jgi:hypothetical protein
VADSKDIRTKFRIEAEAKGFEETEKKAKKLGAALTPEKLASGMQRLDYGMRQMERQFGGLAKHLKGLNQLLHKFGTAVDKVNKLGQGVKKVGDEVEKASQKMRRGAFLQGMIQGAGVGEYIPREGGARAMVAQTGGRMVGRAIAGIGGGLASSPFTGLGGLQTAMQGVPVVGGLMAGQLQQGAAAAQSALAVQQARLSLSPFLPSGGAVRGAMGRARAGVMGEQFARQPMPGFLAPHQGPEDIEAQMRRLQAGETDRRARQRHGGISLEDARRAHAANEDRRAEQFEAGRRGRADAAAGRARDQALGLTELRRQGKNLGAMNQIESMQFAQQLLQRRGGTLKGALKTRGVETALAAQTEYGVGTDVSGAFLQAGRRGGILGARGRGAESMVETIGDAFKAGMDKTEVRDYLAQIAALQGEFVRTGIQINPRSIAGLTRSIRLQGFEQGRAGFIGGAVQDRARQISQQGPQNAVDALLLQTLGKFGGGGLADLEQAQLRLEEGKFGGDELNEFSRKIMQGAGPDRTAQRYALKGAFGGIGAPLGTRESILLQKQAMGEELNPEEQKEMLRIQKEVKKSGRRAPTSIEGLTQEAAKTVETMASGLKRQAGLQTQLEDSGAKFLGIVQDMEKAQRNTLQATSEFAPDLKKVTDAIKSLTEDLPIFAKWMRMIVGGDKPLDRIRAGGSIPDALLGVKRQ